ncbi:MAG: GatB/YqeY domain-containing protein [Gammaproteobacteria bacterium]|jgi:uncharacterized protein YqeY
MADAASDLKGRITEDMKAAMRAREQERLNTIRLILSAIKQVEVDTRETLDDTQVLQVLDKMTKQRRESIAQFEQAGREDLAAKERSELDVILGYMPEPLTDAELDTLIAEALEATGAASVKDMGKVMGYLKPKIQGRADMGALGGRIKQRLSS